MTITQGASARLDAVNALVQIQMSYASRGSSLAAAALAGSREFVEWKHYPRGDFVDSENRSEFYYHAHAEKERAAGEHGHFHVFTRLESGGFVHLVGISLDDRGHATRLFTTNRWVTGEAWAPASEMEPLVRNFAVRGRGRLAPVARWIEALVCLYADTIIELIRERDVCLPNESALDNRSVHIVNMRGLDLLKDIADSLNNQ